jgi:O-antigen/teichoic acid export membrane protein
MSDDDSAVSSDTRSGREDRRRDLRSVLKLGSGAALGQAVAILASPLLARLFDAHAFGVFATFGAITTVIGLTATFKYDQAILLERDDRDAARVFRFCCLVGLAIALLSAVAFGVAAAMGGPAGWGEIARALALFGAPAVFLAAVANALSAWLVRVGGFGALGAAQVTRSLTTAALQAIAGIMATTGAWLVGAQTIAVAASNLTMARGAGLRRVWHMSTRGYRDDVAHYGAIARRYRDFALYGAPQGLGRLLAGNLPLLLLPWLFTPAETGLYWLAYRTLVAPNLVIGQSVRSVFLHRAAAIQANGGDLLGPLAAACRWLSGLYVPVALLLVWLGPALFALVFGEEWRKAGEYARWMALPWAIECATAPASALATVLRLQRALLTTEVVGLVARAVALLAGLQWGDPLVAILAYGIAAALTNAAFLGVVVVRLRSASHAPSPNAATDGRARFAPSNPTP